MVNFDTDLKSSFFAKLYQHSGLKGGHVVMLGADEKSRCEFITPAERLSWAWHYCSSPLCTSAKTLWKTAASLGTHSQLPAACELLRNSAGMQLLRLSWPIPEVCNLGAG